MGYGAIQILGYRMALWTIGLKGAIELSLSIYIYVYVYIGI